MEKLTPRENALMAYHHQVPVWIPCYYTDMVTIQACPELERYTGFDHGKDYWGVDWTYEPTIHAPMPTPGKEPILKDIADWRDVVHFPDLDAIDWEKQADKDVHTDIMKLVMGQGIAPFDNGGSIYDNHDKLRICMIINGPFERLHSLMGFQNALMALAEDPDEVEAFMEAAFSWKIK